MSLLTTPSLRFPSAAVLLARLLGRRLLVIWPADEALRAPLRALATVPDLLVLNQYA